MPRSIDSNDPISDFTSTSDINSSSSPPPFASSPEWSCNYDDDEDDCYNNDHGSSIADDLDFHFEYLNEKQKVLSRATVYMAREDVYAAFTARDDGAIHVVQSEPKKESSLWEEAKDLLATMDRRTGESPTTATTTTAHIVKRSARFASSAANASKRPRIDVSVVKHISSSMLQDGNLVDKITLKSNGSSMTQQGATLDCNFFSTNLLDAHWMAKVLKKYHKAPSTSSTSSWGIQKDPFGGGDKVLLNPDLVASTDVMELETALSFTMTPQLIVTPTPPFSVVHANKAFLVLSGQESHDVIGRAVESLLLHVHQQETLPTDVISTPTTNIMIGWMAHQQSAVTQSDSTNGKTLLNLPCHIRVVPVVVASGQGASSTTTMSHIVLQMHQMQNLLLGSTAAAIATATSTQNPNTITTTLDKKETPAPHRHHGHIIGMIG